MAAPAPFAALYVVAAVVGASVAAALIASGPRRSENWLAVLILGLSAGSSVARGLRLSTDAEADVLAFSHVSLDLEWPVSLLVLALALVYPHRLLRSRAGAVVLAGVLAASAVLWVAVIAWKDVFYPVNWWERPWFTPVTDNARYWTTMAIALALFGRAWARTPASSVDRSAEFLLLAFGVGPIMSAPAYLPGHVQDLFDGRVPSSAWRLVDVVGVILLVGVFASSVIAAGRRGHRVRGVVWVGALATAIGSARAVGEYAGAGELAVGPAIGSYGELGYLVARPALLGFAILRYQLLGLDAGLKRGFTASLLVVVVAALFIPVEEAVRRLPGLPPDLAPPAGIAAGLAVVLLLHGRVQAFADGAGRAVFAGVREGDSAYAEERRREAYRVAVERSMDARLALTPRREAALAELRANLSISPESHDAVLAEVVAARDGGGDAALHEGALLLGRYRVLGSLGAGGGGRAYRCRDERLRREIAVKEVVAPAGDERDRRLREARLLARLHHPRVVVLHEVHEVGDRAFLVMELARGGSLADRLARAPLAPDEARRVIADVLEGLAALHAAGLLHRDVKPSNVLMDETGRAKLADLGVARAEGEATRSGLVHAGTPSYMAPEQVLGEPGDHRSDLYAAAALLYEALVGEPYVRKAMRRGALLEEAIVSAPPPVPVAEVPEWANAFLSRGLAKDPARRFQSAGEAIRAIEARVGDANFAPPDRDRT